MSANGELIRELERRKVQPAIPGKETIDVTGQDVSLNARYNGKSGTAGGGRRKEKEKKYKERLGD